MSNSAIEFLLVGAAIFASGVITGALTVAATIEYIWYDGEEPKKETNIDE